MQPVKRHVDAQTPLNDAPVCRSSHCDSAEVPPSHVGEPFTRRAVAPGRMRNSAVVIFLAGHSAAVLSSNSSEQIARRSLPQPGRPGVPGWNDVPLIDRQAPAARAGPTACSSASVEGIGSATAPFRVSISSSADRAGSRAEQIQDRQ